MAKVTSKLQVTLPKRIAERHGITPGDEIEFVSSGDIIHVVPTRRRVRTGLAREERLRLFDEATARQSERARNLLTPESRATARDWRREELYTRGKPG